MTPYDDENLVDELVPNLGLAATPSCIRGCAAGVYHAANCA